MKIVVVENSRQVIEREAEPVVVVGADSAMLRHSEPVFLPAEGHWSALIAPALRIGRLGLHIPRRVAADYIDGHTLFHLLMPRSAAFDKALWGLSDRTFSPGEWLPGAPQGDGGGWTVSASALYGSSDLIFMQEGALAVSADGAAALVAAISRYSTLKTGDVLIASDIGCTLPLEPDLRLCACLDGRCVLNIKIK